MLRWLRACRNRLTRAVQPARHPEDLSTPRRFALESLEDRLQPSVTLGAAAGFGVLGLANTQINNSNVSISGNEGVSQGGKLTNMAPSTITGTAYEYAAGQYSGPGKLGGGVSVSPALLTQADSDALAAAAQAAALTPTVTLGTVNTPTTITGNGGLNVIAVNGDLNASLILNGTASDVFVVNVTGTVKFGGSSVLGLGGGVTADHVLYNFTGSGGTISSHVGNTFYGTLLAPKYSFNLDGTFNGEIIGGGKSIALLSGAVVNQVPFSPPTPPPPADQTSAISGHVYAQLSDGTTIPLGNVTIQLLDPTGTVVGSTTTAPDGSYAFAGLPAGTYALQEVIDQNVPTSITASGGTYNFGGVNPEVGTVDGSTDGQVGDTAINSILLGTGQTGTNYDFYDFYLPAIQS